MKSLGVIETHGLIAAIQALDAACKAASVACIGYRKVGSGLVSICIEGEISAVITAIERGVSVLTPEQYVGSLAIARPEHGTVRALASLKGRPASRSEKGSEKAAPLPSISAPALTPSIADNAATPATPATPATQDKAPVKKGKKA